MEKIVTVLAHTKVSGSALDGSDWKFSKGFEISKVIKLPDKANPSEEILFTLAKRKIPLLITRLISIK